ncbi:MAG: RIP metalloprotease RseP [Muribaculaceae bacterium]|nr:RIP metalloprotease RseP [Muribaculaceae bacterium]
MNATLIKTLEFFMALGLLVMIHEFGHYFFARVFGVWVEKFYMFFNPWLSIVKWKPGKYVKWFSHGNEMAVAGDNDPNENKRSWRATEYGIGWLPLGGYCSIAGMIDESMNTEAMKQPAKPYEFRSKPAWQRLLIMLGGVLFNFLLAIIIYAGIVYAVGEKFINFTDATEGMEFCDSAHKAGFVDGDIPLTADGKALSYFNSEDLNAMLTARQVTVLRNHKDTVTINLPKDFIFQANTDAEAGQAFMAYRLPVVVSQTQPRMGGEKAGLQEGDRLMAVNGTPTPSYTEFTAALEQNKGKNVTLSYQRGGQTLTATDVPIDGAGKLGILLTEPTNIYHTTVKNYNILQSIPRGLEMGWNKMVTYVKQLKLIFTPQGAQSLGGFGTMGSIFPSTWNWVDFWNITAFFSVILAVMNVLPIPALDGGHVMFLLYEMITRRQPSLKFLERAQTVGMALLIALLVFANGNDIYRFFFK